jgi:hypothetical protein
LALASIDPFGTQHANMIFSNMHAWTIF